METGSKASRHGPRILGIDPGSRVVGFACLESRRSVPLSPKDFRIVDAGVLRTDRLEAHAERLGAIHAMMFELIGELGPDAVVIERAFVGVNINSALKLGEARGALISAAQRAAVPVTDITPAQVKRLVTGQGAASKDAVALAMKGLLGFERGRLPHDVTDAMAIALCHGLTMASARMLANATNAGGARRAKRRKGKA